MPIKALRLSMGLTVSAIAMSLLAGCATPTTSVQKDVTIKRDQYGVPHVYAADTYGVFYGYGYAIATDRLFQMEMAKRTGWGTVAEVLGPDYLETDKATHSRFDPADIQRQVQALSPEDYAIFSGYAAGFSQRVKEVLAKPNQFLPQEFSEYGFLPSEWVAEDIAMVWVGLILNRFFASSSEVTNLQLLQQLQHDQGAKRGQQLYDQLKWLNDPAAPVIIPERLHSAAQPTAVDYLQPLSEQGATHYHHAARLALGDGVMNGVPTASNAWVMSAAKTQEAVPVLYNGPQQGWYTPAITYGIGLHGAGYDLTGITAVGLPAILFGTNGQIAWGSTVGSLDTNDVYQLQLNPDNPLEYWYKGAYRPLEHKAIRIAVKGQDPVELDVYKSEQGYVSAWDTANHTAYANRRSWEGVEIETLLGWAEAAKASNWDEFMQQAQRVAASITWFYADANNTIGAAGLGRLPIRPETQSIQFPAKGDGSMEWLGFHPFSQNPKTLNPSQGFIASWNNKISADLLADSSNFSAVDRVNELLAPLTARAQLSQEEIWAVNQQGAWADLHARYFMPYIVAAAQQPQASQRVKQLASELAAWNYTLKPNAQQTHYEGVAPAVLRAWLEQLTELVLAPNLPASVLRTYQVPFYVGANDPRSAQPAAASKLLWNALQQDQSSVPQTIDFLRGRSASEVSLQALERAVQQLSTKHGTNSDQWRVPVPTMLFSHKNAVGVPWGSATHEQSIPVYGNSGSANFMVVLDKAQFRMCSVIAPGQSGFVHPDGQVDPHYADQLALYANYQCKNDAVGPDQIEQATTSITTLSY
ncbi:MAG TPA: penicillin acylase family protein [Paenalcaligenes hominis]|uniref:Penicillin acylase family protein n=1 Tax=Paenalcaligenes hominis TaxID=643674 RepID=A0A9D3ABE1_9BURK|nr:penicillin acylase family protein [Paenalcaligenes hominis]